MKVQVMKIGSQYNQWGCGYRLLFLIIYNRKSWIHSKSEAQRSIYLHRKLNKLVEYWNYQGNANGRENIIISRMFVPIDSLGKITKEDYTAIETETYGYMMRSHLSKRNPYYKKASVCRAEPAKEAKE